MKADRSERILHIEWEDGGRSHIPFPLLRAACPCAQCRGGHENMRSTPDPEVFTIPLRDARENELADIQPVGNYGITIAWADGHKFGIYTWDYLRALSD
ncbi:MAG TPA: DUF971 domain-containing protein [Anaerolineales bacterium]|nr:DUF971 domain-containing protein [Anaerolineales bacterium]